MKCHTTYCYDIFSFHLIQFSLALSKPLNKLQVNKEEIPHKKLKVNKEEIPPQFEAATNQLQICNWLVAHPNILKLANDMLAASTASPSSTSSTSTSSTSPSSTSPSSVSDSVSKRDILKRIFFIDIYFIFFVFCYFRINTSYLMKK